MLSNFHFLSFLKWQKTTEIDIHYILLWMKCHDIEKLSLYTETDIQNQRAQKHLNRCHLKLFTISLPFLLKHLMQKNKSNWWNSTKTLVHFSPVDETRRFSIAGLLKLDYQWNFLVTKHSKLFEIISHLLVNKCEREKWKCLLTSCVL